ncbi:hypothetical protein GTQ34_16095 [Muricauda sp. JGD-17]|uniref:Uncharacterized protein n=1 Tax=Flagellimonas ochracea TaxID=2696472 RepID=A0A964TEF9_9FLAO|nr:hypothetical protein [Allomuricauda ochracea]NAY93433.1 hypothetical protein [Allomuricauda ochracea]
MAKCPNCKINLPLLKTGFLSRRKNSFKCDNCQKILEADKFLLGVLGATGGGIGAGLIIWHKTIFQNFSSPLIASIVLAIVLILVAAYIQSKLVKLKVAGD